MITSSVETLSEIVRDYANHAPSTIRVDVRRPDGQESSFAKLSTCRSLLIVQDDQQAFDLSK